MPFVTGKVVHKNVVRRTEYNEVVKEREDYFDQYEEQRKQVRDFSKTIDEQTEQIKQKNENLIDQSTKISDTTAEIQLLNSKLEIANKIETRLNSKSKFLQTSLISSLTSLSKNPIFVSP